MILPILNVTDVDTSLAFYTEKLGFTQQMAMPNADGVTTFAFVEMGDFMIGLNADDANGVGKGVDFMLYIPDSIRLDDLYQDVQAKGVPIVVEIKTEYWGDRVFGIKDPDGYSLIFAQTVHEADIEHVAAVMRGEIQR